MWAWFRITLTCLHIVDVRAIECCDNSFNSIQLFGFTGIDGVNISMSKRASKNVKAPCILRDFVFNEYFLSRYKRGSVYFITRLTNNIQLWSERRSYLRLILSIVSQFRRQFYSQIVMLITSVSNKDAGKNIFDFIFSRVWFMLQKPSKNQGCSRCVICTLYNAGTDHGLLYIIKLSAI